MIFEDFWQFITYFGDISYWLGFFVSFAILYSFLDKNDRKKASWIFYALVPSVLISYMMPEFLKILFQVPRPCVLLPNCPTGFSFPSTHAAVAFTFATTAILNLKKRKFYILFVALAVLVGASRFALGYHTLIDVIGGALIGIFVSIVIHKLIYKIFSKGKNRGYYIRKLVHLSGIFVIPLSFIIEKYQLFLLFAFGIIVFVLLEYLRLKRDYIPFFSEIVKLLSDPKELKSILLEPLLYFISIFILFSFFPAKLFYVGTISLVAGDGFAGIIGFRFGKNKLPYNKRKSLEGSFACFISTFGFLLPFLSLFNALLIAIITTILESVLNRGENLILPLAIGFISFYL